MANFSILFFLNNFVDLYFEKLTGINVIAKNYITVEILLAIDPVGFSRRNRQRVHEYNTNKIQYSYLYTFPPALTHPPCVTSQSVQSLTTQSCAIMHALVLVGNCLSSQKLSDTRMPDSSKQLIDRFCVPT